MSGQGYVFDQNEVGLLPSCNLFEILDFGTVWKILFVGILLSTKQLIFGFGFIMRVIHPQRAIGWCWPLASISRNGGSFNRGLGSILNT